MRLLEHLARGLRVGVIVEHPPRGDGPVRELDLHSIGVSEVLELLTVVLRRAEDPPFGCPILWLSTGRLVGEEPVRRLVQCLDPEAAHDHPSSLMRRVTRRIARGSSTTSFGSGGRPRCRRNAAVSRRRVGCRASSAGSAPG
jgi:hypothetical protein